MKANELMIGDYVTFKDSLEEDIIPIKIKIVALGYHHIDEDDSLVQIDDDDSCDLINIDNEVVGYPLTPEILEKNGWGKTPNGYVFYTDGKRYDNSLWYIFGSNTFVVNTAEFQIKYVHELQHLFRFCGIEKEIKL